MYLQISLRRARAHLLVEQVGELADVALGQLERLVLGELVLGPQPGQHPPQPVKPLVQQVHPSPIDKHRESPHVAINLL